MVPGVEAPCPGPLGDLFRVERNEGGEIFAPVPIDHDLTHKRAHLDEVLDVLGRYVLSACSDDDVLLSVRDVEISVVVEGPDVPGVIPVLFSEDLCRHLRLVEVTAKDLVASDENLSVLGDPDLHPRDRTPDRAESVCLLQIAGAQEGLRDPVEFESENPTGVEELDDLLGYRSPPGHDESDPASEEGPDLAQHKARGEGVLGSEDRAGPLSGLTDLADLAPCRDGPLKDLPHHSRALTRLPLDLRVNLLVDPWDAVEDRGADLGYIVHEGLHALRVRPPASEINRGGKADPLVDVGEREPYDAHIVPGYGGRTGNAAARGDDVPMCEDRPLGRPCGTRGVEDDRRVVRRQRLLAPLQLGPE